MIDRLQGQVVEVGLEHLVMLVQGVGYFLNVSDYTRRCFQESKNAETVVYTHMYLREDQVSLYGFSRKEEREIFRALLSVSGVGPKGALAILSTLVPSDFLSAISREDVATLTQAPGVGRKTAQRLILELRGKVDGLMERLGATLSIEAAVERGVEDEAIEALVGLGYSRLEAARAMGRTIAKMGDSSKIEDIIRQALKTLSE